ncbi:MAG: glycosyltransferase family 39 protein [Actinobacteria bacterium]|nr:glycosyltransferase family 39 protein [Actinomycetota bacterium]
MGLPEKTRIYLERPGAKRRLAEIVFLFVLLTSSIFLYNKLNLSGNRWFYAPDDQNIFVFSKVFLETGELWYQSPYNDTYETSAFTPGIHDYQQDPSKGDKRRAAYAPGIYVLVAPGHLLGTSGPFLIVGMLGLIGLLFFYLFMRELFGVKVAMVGALLQVLSPAFVYWSNMLHTNIAAIAFLMGGLYFLARVIREPDRKMFYFLATTFFVIAVWVRGDYAFLAVIIVITVLIGYARTLKWKNVGLSAGLLALLGGLVILINKSLTGSILGTTPKSGSGAQAVETFVRYPLKTVNLEVLSGNVRMYIYGMVPLMVIFGLLGLIYCIRSGLLKNPFMIALLIAAGFTLVYYGKNASFWGYGMTWIASSYVRYFLPVFMVLSILSALFITKWVSSVSPKSLGVAVCAIVILAQALFSLSMLSKGTFGMNFTETWNEASRSIDRFTEGLPENAIIVNFSKDDYYNKMIISRTVFAPTFIKSEDKLEKCNKIIADLFYKGIPIYVISNPDRQLADIDEWNSQNSSLSLEPVSHNIVFNVGGRSPDIYRVNLKSGG